MKKNVFVIVGAGIAGLSAAIALRNIGIEATVVEASETIRPVGAGLSLAANAMEALRHLDLSEEVVLRGNKIKSFTLFDKRGKVIKRVNTESVNQKDSIQNFVIHRADLHEVLLSKIAPENIKTGMRSVSMDVNGDQYEIKMKDGSVIDARYLIIAEGIHSPLRGILSDEAIVRYAGYTCWRGVIDKGDLEISGASETWGMNGRFGLVPMANNQLYWFACINSPERNAAFKNFTPDDLAKNFQDYHDPIVKVIRATPQENLIWGDICDIKPISRFAFGNAVLIGDAAHATTPNMGQGACMALEDAVVLARCLSRNSKVSAAFKDFEQMRLQRAHWIVNESWRLGKMAQTENQALSFLRDTLFRLIPQRLYEKQLASVYHVKFE